MHLLPCPHCDTPISVATTQAGEELNCPACHQPLTVPTLGKLRQLPRAGEQADAKPVAPPEGSMVRRVAFVTCSLLAVASLLIAGFCGIRWVLIKNVGSTAAHIESIRTEYAKVSAAQLVREFEDMDNLSLELTLPFSYKQIENKKRDWGQSASIAGAVGGIAFVAAVLTAGTRRRQGVR